MGNEAMRLVELVEPCASTPASGGDGALLRAWRPMHDPVVATVSHQDAAVQCERDFWLMARAETSGEL